jgi:hypothetical protein
MNKLGDEVMCLLQQKRIQLEKLLLLVAVLSLNSGCTGSLNQAFFSAMDPPVHVQFPALPSPIPSKNIPAAASAQGQFDFLTSITSNSFWLVTTSKNVYNQSLLQNPDGSFPAPKKWTYTNPSTGTAGGARTYVTPYGLFFAKLPGALYRVDTDTPTDVPLKSIWEASKLPSVTPYPDGRACVTSYLIGETSYIGIAWNKSVGNTHHRMFSQFPININLPDKIDLSQEKDVEFSGDNDEWGYSCFIDQARSYFWSDRANTIHGVELTHLTEISGSQMPNASHAVTGLGNYYLDPASPNGSYPYAFSGDKNGNILRGSGVYTFSHSAVFDLIYASQNGSSLAVASGGCYSTLSDCSDSKLFSVFSLTSNDGTHSAVGIGPMSALSDGRIVGLTRGPPSQVYLISPVKPTDISKGLTLLHVSELPSEDTYMYTDFTGATLYPIPIDVSYNLTTFTGYDPTQHTVSASISWTSANGGINPWQNLILQAKCFKGSTPPADLETVGNVLPSGGAQTPLNIPSCQAGSFDHIRFKVTPNSATSSNFSRSVQIQVYVNQSP